MKKSIMNVVDEIWDGLSEKFDIKRKELKKIDPENKLLSYRSMNEVVLSEEYTERAEVAPCRIDAYLSDIDKEIERLKSTEN